MLTDGVEVPHPADRRILLALDYLRDNVGGPVSLHRVAAVVHLSPSRFRHLFVLEMGLPFRHYVLWLRLNRAVEVFASGESLTTAAYRAGFADSAHLSRTFPQDVRDGRRQPPAGIAASFKPLPVLGW